MTALTAGLQVCAGKSRRVSEWQLVALLVCKIQNLMFYFSNYSFSNILNLMTCMLRVGPSPGESPEGVISLLGLSYQTDGVHPLRSDPISLSPRFPFASVNA